MLFSLILIQIVFDAKITYQMSTNNSADSKNYFNSLIVDYDPLELLSQEELLKVASVLVENQRNTSLKMKSKFKNYLEINSSMYRYKSLFLNRFLAEKSNQYLDYINLLLIPEFRPLYKSKFKILKSNSNYQTLVTNLDTIGTTSCNLEKVALASDEKETSVCPWHHVNKERDNVFPFTRSFAKCNCNDCQAKTIFDSDYMRTSSCTPFYSLMPALLREKISLEKERWWFSLEEVSTSCYCSVMLKTFEYSES